LWVCGGTENLESTKETNLFRQSSTKDNHGLLSVGFNYTLPMLSVFQAEVFQNGDVRLQPMREDDSAYAPVAGAFMINTDKDTWRPEIRRYQNIGISTHYDNYLHGLGAGVTLTY
jgi:hypothetical protein